LFYIRTSKLLPHRINLIPNAKPIKLKAYKLSKAQSMALKEILTFFFINNRLIEPSFSALSFPVVLVHKKNNKDITGSFNKIDAKIKSLEHEK